MPELPEVETISSSLRRGVQAVPIGGMQVLDVTSSWPRHFSQPSYRTFKKHIRGRTIQDVRRRGKYLLFPLDERTMLIHLRMSGDLFMKSTNSPAGRYDHTVFHLEDGWDLRFSDARKFGRVHLLKDPQKILGKLGPEPLDDEFTSGLFFAMLNGRNRQIKPLLLDQSFIAGIGNIYADEALHRAGIHPLRKSDTLGENETRALWSSIRETLHDGIQRNGASIDWVYRGGEFQNDFKVYSRNDEPCLTCSTPIRRISVGQRGTYFCPSCQPEVPK
jgi:formamidopyrimidine-DNA glycosylase